MPDEQPHYFTAIDLFWDVLLTSVVAAGCYAGWVAGGSFLALLAGGIGARVASLGLLVGVRSLVVRGATSDRPAGT